MVARALLTLAALCSLLVAPYGVRAEVAGAGNFTADFDGSFPSFFFNGTVDFAPSNPDFFVAGQPVDLDGTFPNGGTIDEGILIVDTFSFELNANSTSGAFLRFFNVNGKAELCTTAGCTFPEVTFVGFPSFVQFSEGVLPEAERLYVVDGTVPFNFSGGDDVDGVFGINAFPPYLTSPGSAFIDTGIDVFFDSVKERIVPYQATVQYHGIVEPGLTYIVPVSAATGALPAGVVLNTGGVESVFVDIEQLTDIGTLADGAQGQQGFGATVCLVVNPDDDPPTVPLDQLVLLHRASVGGAFVDTGAELLLEPTRLCTTVPTLSPFVIGVDTTPGTTTSTLPPTTSSTLPPETTTTTSTSSTTSSIPTTSTTVTTSTSTSAPSTIPTSTSTSTSTSSTSTSTSTSSSTAPTSSSSTSSSTTTSSTTSTTPGCTDEATFASILCRIDILIGVTEAGDIDQRVQETLLARLAKARAVVLEAEERFDAGIERGAMSKLKSAERRMRGYSQRVNSLAGRRGIMDPGLAAVLTDHAEAIEDDIKALRLSL